MATYNPIIIKFILGMLTLIFQINIFGKGNLAPTTALDQIQNYVLGGIIGGVIYNNDISAFEFLMVLIIWTLIVFILRFARDHNTWVRSIINGKPVQLIANGKVLVQNCLRTGISADQLMFRLRANGIYSVQKVKNCVLEQNGQLVIIENDEANIRYPIINDGQINDDVLELIHKDAAWLEAEVRKSGYQSIDDIFLGEYNQGQLKFFGYSSVKPD